MHGTEQWATEIAQTWIQLHWKLLEVALVPQVSYHGLGSGQSPLRQEELLNEAMKSFKKAVERGNEQIDNS